MLAVLSPTVGHLYAFPPAVLDQNGFRLEAAQVTTSSGTIAAVTFYRENNNVDGLQTGVDGDELVATDIDSNDGWGATVVHDPMVPYGPHTFYAQAMDTSGARSADGQAAPSVTISRYQSEGDIAGDDLANAWDNGELPVTGKVITAFGIGNGIYGRKDVDLHKFSIPWTATITISVLSDETSGPTTLNSFLRIFDADGVDLSANADRTIPDDMPEARSVLEITLSPGTYYIGVSGLPNRYYDPNVAGQGKESETTDLYRLSIAVEAPSGDSWNPLISVNAQYDDPATAGFGQYLIGEPVADLENLFTVTLAEPPGYTTTQVVFDKNFNGKYDSGDYTDSDPSDGWTWMCNVSDLRSTDTNLRVWALSGDEWSDPVDRAIHTFEVPDWMDPDPDMTTITYDPLRQSYAISSLIGTRIGVDTPASWPDWLEYRNGKRTWNGIYFGDLVEAKYSLGGKVTDQELSSVIGFSIFGFGAPLKYNKGFATSGSITIDVYKLFKAAEDLDSLLPESKEKAKSSKMPTVNPPKVTLTWAGNQILGDDLELRGQSTFNIALDAKDLLEMPIPPIIVPLTPIPLDFVVTPHFGLGFEMNVGWQWDSATGFDASNFGVTAYVSAGAAAELQVLGGVFKGGLDATVSGYFGFNATHESDGDWSWQIPVGLGIDLDVVGSAFWGLVSGRFNLLNFSVGTDDILGGSGLAASENDTLAAATDAAMPTVISSAVAQSSAGDMAIAWSQVDFDDATQPLLVQQRKAGQDWGTVETVAASDHFRGDPTLAYLPDGRLLMLWSESKLDPANVSKPDLDQVQDGDAKNVAVGQEIFWSVRNSNGWTAPAALTVDALLDDQPALVVRPDGTAVVVWRHASQDNVADPSAMDLWYATFDGTTWSPPVEMFNDEKLNGQSALTVLESGDVLATWLSSTTLAGEDATIRSSVLQGGNWSAPTTIGEDAQGMRQAIRLVVLPDHRVLVFWTEATDDGQTMRMAIRDPVTGDWGASTEILPSQEWIGAPTVTVYESRVDVTWHSVDRDNSSIFSVSRDFADDQGKWTVPRELTGATGENWWPLAATDASGNVNVVYVADPSHATGESQALAAASSANIATLTAENLPDLTVTTSDISLVDMPAASGQVNSVRVAVRNQGLADSAAFTVCLYDGDPNVEGTLIGSQQLAQLDLGDEAELVYSWTPTEGTHDLWVVIDEGQTLDESDETNNAASLVVVCVEAPTLAVDPASDTGDPGDGWTVDVTPTLIGTTTTGTSVALFVDTQQSAAAQATVTGGSYVVTLPELTSGPHSIWAQAFDSDGNPSPFSEPLSLVVDLVSLPTPETPTLDAASDTGELGDGITMTVRPRIDGLAGSSAMVDIYWDTTILGRTFADANGSYFLVPNQDLAGVGEITAVQVDASGNQSAPSAPLVLEIDVPPTVTVNQAQTQTDPAGSQPIHFTVVFSEEVTDFTAADVTLSGTASGAKVDSVATWGSDGRTYDVAVTGLTGDGTVTAAIAAGAVHDATGNENSASTSVDNTVTYSPNASASLEGHVRLANVDGEIEDGIGLPGVTIKLSSRLSQGGWTLIDSLETDDQGHFVFSSLPGGEYQLVNVHPHAFTDDDDHAGSAGGVVDSATDTIDGIVLAGTETADGYTFTEGGLRVEYISIKLFFASTPQCGTPEWADMMCEYTHITGPPQSDGLSTPVSGEATSAASAGKSLRAAPRTSQGGDVRLRPGTVVPLDPANYVADVGEAATNALLPALESLRGSAVLAIAQESLSRWSSIGLDTQAFERLARTELRLADLPGDELARAVDSTVSIDPDAAGNGWFIDPTPALDEEFAAISGQQMVATAPGANARIDLLTVVLHEFGHVLGLDDVDANNGLMNSTLGPGARRLPSPHALDQVFDAGAW